MRSGLPLAQAKQAYRRVGSCIWHLRWSEIQLSPESIITTRLSTCWFPGTEMHDRSCMTNKARRHLKGPPFRMGGVLG